MKTFYVKLDYYVLWKEGKVLCKADKYVTIKHDKMKSKMKQKKPK